MKRTIALVVLAFASLGYAGTHMERHCDFDGHAYGVETSCAIYSNWYFR